MPNAGVTVACLLHADAVRHVSEFNILNAVHGDQTPWNPTEWQTERQNAVDIGICPFRYIPLAFQSF